MTIFHLNSQIAPARVVFIYIYTQRPLNIGEVSFMSRPKVSAGN